jgi:hypothetical protein
MLAGILSSSPLFVHFWFVFEIAIVRSMIELITMDTFVFAQILTLLSKMPFLLAMSAIGLFGDLTV